MAKINAVNDFGVIAAITLRGANTNGEVCNFSKKM